MHQNISDVIDRIKVLEEELEREFGKRREEFYFNILTAARNGTK